MSAQPLVTAMVNTLLLKWPRSALWHEDSALYVLTQAGFRAREAVDHLPQVRDGFKAAIQQEVRA